MSLFHYVDSVNQALGYVHMRLVLTGTFYRLMKRKVTQANGNEPLRFVYSYCDVWFFHCKQTGTLRAILCFNSKLLGIEGLTQTENFA